MSELTWAGIANLKGDVQDAEVGFQKQLPRHFHSQMNKVLGWAPSWCFLEQAAEVRNAHARFGCQSVQAECTIHPC